MRPSAASVRVVALGCLLLVVAAALVACGSDEPQPAPSPHTYVNEEHHFAMLLDNRFEDIRILQDPEAAFKVGFFDKDGGASGVTPDGMWIVVVDKKANASRNAKERSRELDKLLAELEAGAPKGVVWHKTTIGGLPAAWTEDVMPINKYKRITCLVAGRRNVYVIAGAATPETWAASRSLFTATFDSFKEI